MKKFYQPNKEIMVSKIIALEKSGRRSSGWNGDHGHIAHALEVKEGRREMDVEGGNEPALCGDKPIGTGNWSSHQSALVTCHKCLSRLAAGEPNINCSPIPDAGEPFID